MEEKSCGIIPIRSDKGTVLYLLIQHRAGHWGFPKGHQHEGETDLETAQREFNEETGLTLKKIFTKKSYLEEYDFYRDDEAVHKSVTYFLGLANEGEVQIQVEEIKNHAWLPYEVAYDRLHFPEIKKILEEAHAAIPSEVKLQTEQ